MKMRANWKNFEENLDFHVMVTIASYVLLFGPHNQFLKPLLMDLGSNLEMGIFA